MVSSYSARLVISLSNSLLLPLQKLVKRAQRNPPPLHLLQAGQLSHFPHNKLPGDERVGVLLSFDLLVSQVVCLELPPHRLGQLPHNLVRGEPFVGVRNVRFVKPLRVQEGLAAEPADRYGVDRWEDGCGRERRRPDPLADEARVHHDKGLKVVCHKVSGAQQGPVLKAGRAGFVLDDLLASQDRVNEATGLHSRELVSLVGAETAGKQGMFHAGRPAGAVDVLGPSPLPGQVRKVGHEDQEDGGAAGHGRVESLLVVVVTGSELDSGGLQIVGSLGGWVPDEGVNLDVLGSKVAGYSATLAASGTANKDCKA